MVHGEQALNPSDPTACIYCSASLPPEVREPSSTSSKAGVSPAKEIWGEGLVSMCCVCRRAQDRLLMLAPGKRWPGKPEGLKQSFVGLAGGKGNQTAEPATPGAMGLAEGTSLSHGSREQLAIPAWTLRMRNQPLTPCGTSQWCRCLDREPGWKLGALLLGRGCTSQVP